MLHLSRFMNIPKQQRTKLGQQARCNEAVLAKEKCLRNACLKSNFKAMQNRLIVCIAQYEATWTTHLPGTFRLLY